MSRARLCRRIEKLERSQPVKPHVVEPPLPRIIEQLTAWGFVRQPNESWAEVLADAMGITCEELKAQLHQRAYGG